MAANKLILGTVQFGVDYGVNNQSGKVEESEVCNILNLASSSISMLDTSSAYGSSEQVLGRMIAETKTVFKIISKYPKSELSIEEFFRKSLICLGQSCLYGYLVHNFEFYLLNPSQWDQMRALRDKGLVEKIGFSLYSTEELDYLLKHNIDFDLLQLPYSVLDRQFESYLPLLKERKVEIHVRSVFLQGLIFKDIHTLSDKLLPFTPYLQSLKSYCDLKNISVEELALNFVLSNDNIDGVLIGVDNSTQLRKNIKCSVRGINSEDIDFIESIQIKEKQLLNPVNWE